MLSELGFSTCSDEQEIKQSCIAKISVKKYINFVFKMLEIEL